MQSIQHGLADIASVRYAHSFDAVAEGIQVWLSPLYMSITILTMHWKMSDPPKNTT